MLQLFLALIVSVSQVPAQPAPPFWRAKDKVYARVQNRDVVVSVRAVEKRGGSFKNQLSLSGGGQVGAPCGFVFQLTQNYAAVAEHTGYMENSKFDAASQTLTSRISAFGYKADVAVRFKAESPVGAAAEEPFIGYEVLKGPMTGMKGRFVFYSASSQKCDVGMDGEYGYDKFPMPQLFLRFGMEVLFQRMAGKLRSYAEEQYGKAP